MVDPVADCDDRRDAAEVWAGLDLGRRRAILETLAIVWVPATAEAAWPGTVRPDQRAGRVAVIKMMLPDEHRGRPRKTASAAGDLPDDRTEINDTGGVTGADDIDWDLFPCTAFHEAGHAWGYYHTCRPLRFVTIEAEDMFRGRTVGLDSWEPLIAAAGPIAETRWYFTHYEPGSAKAFTFQQYLHESVIKYGAHQDYRRAAHILDDPKAVRRLRTAMARDWELIEALANKLMEVVTVTGPEVADVFYEAKYGPKQVRR